MTPGRIGLLAIAFAGMSSISAQAETIQVVIDKLVFAPAEVAAKVGDTVEWVNKDMLAHTATAKDKSFNVVIAPNKSGQTKLSKAGAVEYYCTYHPNMTGRITVAP